MSAPAVQREVRWRVAGAEASDWVTQVQVASSELALTSLTRGVLYDIQIRNVAANGKRSNWVDISKLIATTNREGAAALPTNAVANQASMWDLTTTVTYNASSPTTGASSATISVSAGTLVIGSKAITYAPSSATVTGAAGSQVTYYLYYDDPQLVGGSRVLGLASNIVASANVDGRIALAPITVKFPAAGSSGSGGGSIGGGGGSGGAGSCPWVEAWVVERERGAMRACEVQAGDWLLSVGGSWVRVTYSERKRAQGVRIGNTLGHQLTCSAEAPILTISHGFVSASDLAAVPAIEVDVTGDGPGAVTALERLGEIDVQHISCAGHWPDRVFLVGDDPAHLFPHHNAKQVQ